MPTIEVNGESIHYERAGSGPTLAMFHSLGTNSYLWEEQISRLQDQYTCVAFDARGHGKSTNNGGVTMKAVAEDAYAVLKALGLLPAVIMGISMGGLQCAHFYAKAPDDVTAIVYADSFAFVGEAGLTRIEGIEKAIGELSMAEYAKSYANDTLAPGTKEPHFEALIAAIAGMKAEDYLQTTRSVFMEDVRGQLKNVKKPMKIVVGADDNRTPPAASEAVQSLVSGSEMTVIPAARHLANIDNPDGFFDAVYPFLKQFSASGS